MDEQEENTRELSRAKSFTLYERESAPELSSKYKTATPSVLTKFRLGTIKKRPKNGESSEVNSGSALDDLICLDSFEEINEASAHIDVTRSGLRQALQDELRTISNHADVFAELEKANVSLDNVTIRGLSTLERNVAFLASAMLNRHDILDWFLEYVDRAFHETKYGFGALHIASFCGSLEFCKKLLSLGSSVNPNYGVYSPLHCAALGDNPEILKCLVEAGAHLEKSHPAGETPLASAVRAHSVACVRLLLGFGVDVNASNSCGMRPLHLAADLGNVQVVRALLQSELCAIDGPTRPEENTALHIASLGASSEIVQLLLEKGATANARNAKQKTPLHFSSRACLECTEMLLKKGADPNAADVEQRTALHTAVARSEVRFGAEVTKLLLSWGAAVNRQDRYGYTPLHIAALNELPDCAETLVRHGADVTARTRGNTAALGLLARKTPSALDAIRSVLDSHISCNDPEVSYREIKLSFNFKYLLQGCGRGEMNFLQTVVDEGQRTLLEHPLCEAFLHLKWQKIRKYYIARLLFCLFFMSLLSVYVLVILAYQCYEENGLASRTNFYEFNYNKSLCNNKSSVGVWLRDTPSVLYFETLLLVIVASLEICRKIYGINGYKSAREYFNLSNLVEWFVVAAVGATSYIFMDPPASLWQNHVGAFAVLMGWANLMVMIGHLPIFGSYVAMYTKVQKEFAKILSAYICLLIGFTVCFCAIFVKSSSFENPFIGFVKILVMMTGEFDFSNLLQDIGREPEAMLPKSPWNPVILQTSALIAFVLFLLFVTIILINLLIGIAVHDIQGLQKTAGLSKLVGLTNLISQIEAALFGPRVPACVMHLLSSTSGISTLVTVNPLNSRERRLPRDILRAGLTLARQSRAKSSEKRQTFALRRTDTIGDGPGQELIDVILSLSDEVRQLKQLIQTMIEK